MSSKIKKGLSNLGSRVSLNFRNFDPSAHSTLCMAIVFVEDGVDDEDAMGGVAEDAGVLVDDSAKEGSSR